MDLLLRRATEMAVTAVHPILCRNGGRIVRRDHWSAVIREAGKQSKNPFLPVLHPPLPLGKTCPPPPGAVGAVAALAAGAIPWKDFCRRYLSAAPMEIYLAVGPEGDFSADEYEHLRARGFVPIHLGPRVLTVDSAAMALLAGVRLELGWQ
jgi:16S rRNA (uracil1498-N3)-methyltransferase